MVRAGADGNVTVGQMAGARSLLVESTDRDAEMTLRALQGSATLRVPGCMKRVHPCGTLVMGVLGVRIEGFRRWVSFCTRFSARIMAFLKESSKLHLFHPGV